MKKPGRQGNQLHKHIGQKKHEGNCSRDIIKKRSFPSNIIHYEKTDSKKRQCLHNSEGPPFDGSEGKRGKDKDKYIDPENISLHYMVVTQTPRE